MERAEKKKGYLIFEVKFFSALTLPGLGISRFFFQTIILKDRQNASQMNDVTPNLVSATGHFKKKRKGGFILSRLLLLSNQPKQRHSMLNKFGILRQNHQRRQPIHQGNLIFQVTNELLMVDNWDLK